MIPAKDKMELQRANQLWPRYIVKEHPMMDKDADYIIKGTPEAGVDIIWVPDFYRFVILNPCMLAITWEQKMDLCCKHAMGKVNEVIWSRIKLINHVNI